MGASLTLGTRVKRTFRIATKRRSWGNPPVEMNASGNRCNLCAHNFQRPNDQRLLASNPPERPDLVNSGVEKRSR
jgi:hypothetical protein